MGWLVKANHTPSLFWLLAKECCPSTISCLNRAPTELDALKSIDASSYHSGGSGSIAEIRK